MAEEDELKTITGEESLGNFMELVQKLKDEPWTSRLNDILDTESGSFAPLPFLWCSFSAPLVSSW